MRAPAARPLATTSTVPNAAVTASTSTSSIPSNTSESQNGASVCMTSTITVHNRPQQRTGKHLRERHFRSSDDKAYAVSHEPVSSQSNIEVTLRDGSPRSVPEPSCENV